MSRSKKKTPVVGTTTSETEKDDKRKANRKLRRATKIEVHKEKEVLPEAREVSNVWAFGKDGKRYLKDANKKELRK